jgi:hypothetical protein
VSDPNNLGEAVCLADAGRLEFHPLANIFPLIEGAELEGLKASIKALRITHPITLHEGKILDGRNRYLAARAIGYQFTIADFVQFKGADPRAFVYAANVHRRHLSATQKADLVKRMLTEYPNKKDREIADMLGVSHMTVWKYRQPETDKVFDAFIAKWKALTEPNRARFTKENAADLRALCTKYTSF